MRAGLLLLLWGLSLGAYSDGREIATIWSAVQVLEDLFQDTSEEHEEIPVSLLRQSDAVVILPGMITVGWGVGVSHGSGVMLFRHPPGWSDPIFVTLTGASIGYQAGAQATDLVLSFRDPNAVNSLLNGKITMGVDAAIAAGPIGRDTTLATDSSLDAEIYSWSHSRGLFVGVALDGSRLAIDEDANALFYNQPGITSEDILQQPTSSRASGVHRLKGLLQSRQESSNHEQ